MKVKLCGFTQKNSLEVALKNGADFIGFVFCPDSARYIDPNKVSELANIIPKTVFKVAVLANNDLENISQIYQNLTPNYFQFHGSETVEFILEVKKKFPQVKIIKAFRIANSQDLEQVKNFEEIADLFLFDSKKSSALGGSGEAFDWKILNNLKSKKDWFLSGGLNINNISEALQISGAKMIDISSGIEKIRGEKSPELIEQLMTKIKKYVA